MADQEGEATAGAEERVEPLADLTVVGPRGGGRLRDEQLRSEHPGLEAVVDALTVHRVHEAGGVTDGDPPRAVPSDATHGEPPGAGSFQVGPELPVPLHQRPIRVLQVVQVQLLEPLHGGQGAHPDVHGAVAGGEHPAVAGDRDATLVAEGEAGLEVPLGMAGCLGVGADGEAERLAGVPLGPEQPGGRAGRAGGQHREVPRPRPVVRRHPGDASVLDDRKCVVLVAQLGAGIGRQLHEPRVEAPSGPHRAVGGEGRDAGPVELSDRRVGDHPQAVDAVGVVERDAEVAQGPHRPRGEAVTTHLVPAGPRLLEHCHAGAGTGGHDGGSGTGRAATDHQQVASLGGAHRHSLRRGRVLRGIRRARFPAVPRTQVEVARWLIMSLPKMPGCRSSCRSSPMVQSSC